MRGENGICLHDNVLAVWRRVSQTPFPHDAGHGACPHKPHNVRYRRPVLTLCTLLNYPMQAIVHWKGNMHTRIKYTNRETTQPGCGTAYTSGRNVSTVYMNVRSQTPQIHTHAHCSDVIFCLPKCLLL